MIAASSSRPLSPRCIVLALCLLSCSSRGETSRIAQPIDRSEGAIPALSAQKVRTGAIEIDGRMDDDAWKHAGKTEALVHPTTGKFEAGSRVRGEAFFAWDASALYVAFRVLDPSPDAPFDAAERDPHIWEKSSGIEVMLQPGDHADNRVYFEIQTDTKGAIWSTRFDDYNAPVERDATGATRFGHQEWDPPIRTAATIDSAGYTLELAIPWVSLRTDRSGAPPNVGDVWRANIYTFRDGQADALAWSPILGRGNFHFSPRWGRVTFAGP